MAEETKPQETDDAPAETQDDPTVFDARLPHVRRDDTMGRLSEARLAELEEDGVDVSVMAEEEPANDGEEAAADPETEAGPEPDPEPEAEEQMVTVTIDGKEQQVKQSALVDNYQMEQTGRQRLQEATDLLKQAQDATSQPAPQPEPVPEPTPATPEVDWTALAEKLQYADKEDAGAALQDAVEALRASPAGSPPADPNASAEAIEQRVTDRIEYNTALADFGDSHPDIFGGSVEVAHMAGQIANGLMQKDFAEARAEGRPRKPYLDHFQAAGEHMRGVLKGYTAPTDPGENSGEDDPEPKPTTPIVEVSSDRVERKRAASTVPVAGGKARPSEKESDQKQFGEDAEAARRSAAIDEIRGTRFKNRAASG